MPAHPTLFLKKNIYQRYGNYRTDFGTGSDYEFILRVLFKNNIKCKYIDQVITKMRVGGISSNNIKDRIIAHIYDWKSWTTNDLSVFPFGSDETDI